MMPCPTPSCTGKRKVEQLMCRTCWFRLPAAIRAPLFKYWRASEKQPANEIWWRRYRQELTVANHWLTTHPAKVAAL